MTTHTELLEIVNNGESSGVEFKRDVLQNHDLAKELVAFSNLAGGMVLLGVDDDGNAFKNSGEMMLADGANRCVVFLSVTHGELSVLDNNLFAVAKDQ